MIKKYIIESLKYILRSQLFVTRYVKEIEALYQMSPNELRARNEKCFLKLFNRAYDNSSFYKKLYSDAGIKKDDIKCLEDIKKLPIITKDMIKAHADEIRIAPKWKLIKNHTSGTTGTPLMVYEDWPSIWREQAYFYCYRKRCGYTYGQPIVSLRGNLTKNEISLKVHISNTLFLSSYNINEKTAKTYHRLINAHNPKAIEGYPSSLYCLALVFKDQNLDCHIPVAFTSSETLFDYQKKLIEGVFHTQIYDHYGTTERTIRLEESLNHKGYYEDPGYGIEEYKDDHIISTSLINNVFPLIRYRTDDRIVLKSGVRKTKEGFIDYSGIDRIDGRAIAFIEDKNGTRYSDSALTFIFKDVDGVRFAQFIQKVAGVVILNIVPDESFSKESEHIIMKGIDRTIGLNNIDVKIELIKEKDLKKSKRDKLSLVINETDWGGVIFKVVGRTDDVILCKDGSMVTRIDFIEEGNHINACQWIQYEKGKLEIRVAPREGFTDKDIKYVVDETLKRCGYNNIDINVKVCSINDMIYSKRGKFQLIVNKIK